MSEVFTLLVETGRKDGDGLPEGSTGCALLVFCPAKEEKLAVSDTVRILREAGLSPLEVQNYGTVSEREQGGHEFSEGERELIEEARRDGSIIIVEKMVLFGEEDTGQRH